MFHTWVFCRVAFGWFLLGCMIMTTHSQTPALDMRHAAVAWLETAGDLKTKAVFPFQTQERENWSYVPMPRKGVSLGEMNEQQRKLLQDLLRTALSQRGYLQATSIVSLEVVLREIEKSTFRDPDRYFLTIFGEPKPQTTWGWRFEGHHLSLNFLVINGNTVTVAPAFFGSNPAESVNQGKPVRPLAREEDVARDLIQSLNSEQRRIAIFSEAAPREIITGTTRNVSRLQPDGIGFSNLEAAQQAKLKELVEVYVHRYRAELAKEDLQRISNAGWEKVSFAWAGGLQKGQGHYYRVQGPTFLLEYDNTQNRANHIHTVWRDLQRDFGGDLLKAHYHAADHRHE